ncbi:chemotaxis protein CheX [bacterium]|nr:chemotaxis protein CheX [bacterium]
MAIQKEITSEKLKVILVESASEVFQKMVMLTITPVQKESVSWDSENKHYSAVIGFSGGWKGFVTVECSGNLAQQITGKMLYMDPAQLAVEDIRDAMGEMVNMIGGKFKSCFSEQFNDGAEAFRMSIPTVTYGKEFRIFAAGDSAQIMVVLDVENSFISLDLTLKQSGTNFGSRAVQSVV